MLPHCEPRQTRLSFCNPVCREFLASLRRMDASWVRCFLRGLYGFLCRGNEPPASIDVTFDIDTEFLTAPFLTASDAI
jgi:hypothetical protein